MKPIKTILYASFVAVSLAGCGGGGGSTSSNSVGFTSLVSFGDSLSDAGTYAVGTIAAVGGGRYTVNSGTATPTKIWLDYVAAQLALTAPCAAVKGLDGYAAQGFSVPPTSQASCTNYAQGGSRVTHPIGPGNKNIPSSAALGQLTYPLTTQVAEHLGRNASAFNPKALVTVMAGGNDIFIQGAVAAAAAAMAATPSASNIEAFTATATNIGGWSSAEQLAVLTATSAAAGQAALQAGLLANMAKAGSEQANLVKAQIVAKGAKYVLVVNLPNAGATPMGFAGGPQTAALSTAMAVAFNQTLTSGLAGTQGVVVADAFTTSTDQYNNPSAYGLSNVTVRSCKTDASNILGGVSLVCNPTNVIAGDISRYGFADDVHPAPYGHQLLGQFAAKALATAGWL
ncbi:MAG: esterase [Burkholderiales bacterium PBB3]|nr:MAG: esterase [Burkholderiales bacterium PBB3]